MIEKLFKFVVVLIIRFLRGSFIAVGFSQRKNKLSE